jgi:energy-coupling factor transport system permease protein
MLRDITLGQYYPADSWIHRLDPRVKIIGSLLYIVSLFLVKNYWGFGVALVYLAVVTALSTVPLRFMLRGLKPIFILILFTFVLNLLMTSGDILWQWRFLKITRQGIYNACFMALRLIFLILGSSLLTLTTKPIALTDGLEKLLSPFRKIGLPAHELAMMMTIALRFIPTLME